MNTPVEYIPDSVSDPSSIFTILWNELEWEKRTNRRIEYWTNILDRPYTYGSGEGARTYYPRVSHPIIDDVTSMLEDRLGFRYEACFLNGYETGKNGLSWHADDDPGIDHSKPIAVVTLYDGPVVPVVEKIAKNGTKAWAPSKSGPGERIIQFKPIDGDKTTVESVSMANGSLLLMKPGMQSTHFHQIPNAGGYVTRPRISLTYRSLIR